MQTRLDYLKKNQICPILADNDWEYSDLAQPDECFQSCALEVMGWYGRRGSTLSPTVLYTVVEQMLLKKSVNPAESDVVDAIKDFTQSTIYKKIDQPLINVDIQLKIEDNVITHEIPVLAKADESSYVIMFDQTIQDADSLSRSIEVRFISVWAFYILNTYINVYNVVKDGSKSRLISVKPTQDYIKESKKTILNMQYLSYNKNHPAHHLVCRACSRRDICPIITMKPRTKAK
jgi:hypothetical protein